MTAKTMLSSIVISNQKSGKNKLDWKRYNEYRGLNKIKRVVKDGDYGKVYVTGKSKDYISELDSVMMESCKLEPDIFIFDGGDSTIMTCITLLDRHWKGKELPLVATTKGGSFLMIPRRLKQKKTFKFLEDIIHAESIDDLTVKGIELMKITDDKKNDHLSYSTGTGLLVDILDEVYKKKSWKYVRVVSMYVKTLASVILGGKFHKELENKHHMAVTAKGHKGRIRGDKLKVENDFLGISAQTIDFSQCFPWFFPKMKIFNKAETPGLFQAVGTTWDFEKVFKYSLIGELEATLDFNKQLKEMKIQSDKPFRYQSNGDLSFGYNPFLTRELSIKSYMTANFVIGR